MSKVSILGKDRQVDREDPHLTERAPTEWKREKMYIESELLSAAADNRWKKDARHLYISRRGGTAPPKEAGQA